MKKILKISLPILAITIALGVFFILNNQQVSADTCPFINDLPVGTESNEVTLLQTFLYQQGYYPEGKITGYFGSLTSKAVSRFQKAKGIYQTGFVGPATRDALCSSYSTSGGCPFTTPYLSKGTTSAEVRALQLFLINQVNYPTNMVTGYFGPLTERYVKTFQTNNSLTANGTMDFDTRSLACSKYSSGASLSSSSTGSGSDLIISDMSFAPTANIQVGTDILIGAKEKNNGTQDAPAHTYDLYLNDYRLFSGNLSALKAGQEKTINVNQWTCTQPGLYYFKIVLDPLNAIKENSKLNNTSIITVNCGNVADNGKYSCNTSTWQCVPDSSGPHTGKAACDSVCLVSDKTQPDLVISDFTPKTFTVGKDTTITVTEKNIGGVVANYHYLTAFIGSDTIRETQIGQSTLLYSLDPGTSKDSQFTFNCPAAGSYYLKFITDSQYNVQEGNKNNNVFSANITCTAGTEVPGKYKYTCDTVSKKCFIDTDGTFLTGESCLATCAKSSGTNPGQETSQPNLTFSTADPGNCQGNKFVIPFTVTNSGAGKSVATKVAILKDNLTSTPACTGDVPALNPGQAAQVTCNYVCTDTTLHKLYFMVDYGNTNTESNEQDNVLVSDPGVACPEVCTKPDTTPPSSSAGGAPGGGYPGKTTGPISSADGKLRIGWFTVSPEDCYNCPQKRCQGMTSAYETANNEYGQSVIYGCQNFESCSDKMGRRLSFYRESPHEMTFSYNVDNFNRTGAKCTIYFGDAANTTHDCSFTGQSYYGPDRDESTAVTAYKYSYLNNTTAPIKVCPYMEVIADGITLKTSATNAFCDGKYGEGYEDSTKCFVIYPEGWGFGPRDTFGNSFGWLLLSFGAAPTGGSPGDTITFSWKTNVTNTMATAWCNLKYGDGTEEVFRCKSYDSRTHVYTKAGTFTAQIRIDDDFEQTMHCQAMTTTVVITGSGSGGGQTSRYACNSSGQCISSSSGPYTQGDCDGKCSTAQKRYTCSNGKCVESTAGSYTTSNCDNRCTADSGQKRYSIKSTDTFYGCVENSNGAYCNSTCTQKCTSTSTSTTKYASTTTSTIKTTTTVKATTTTFTKPSSGSTWITCSCTSNSCTASYSGATTNRSNFDCDWTVNGVVKQFVSTCDEIKSNANITSASVKMLDTVSGKTDSAICK